MKTLYLFAICSICILCGCKSNSSSDGEKSTVVVMPPVATPTVVAIPVSNDELYFASYQVIKGDKIAHGFSFFSHPHPANAEEADEFVQLIKENAVENLRGNGMTVREKDVSIICVSKL
jgi:hypothetical protein